MSPTAKGWIHIAAALVVPAGFFNMLPQPWNVIVGAIAAGIIAAAAFLNQSISNS